jgi:hypothetical protein
VRQVEGSTLVVPWRFRGPATSGNGGWTAGALAARLSVGPVRVRLSAPPPLDTPLDVADDEAGGLVARAADGGVVAQAAVLADDETPRAVPPVSFDEALAAGERYPGLHDHPFPECFACGVARAPGDGLRLRPGRTGGGVDGRVAAAWVPVAAQLDGDVVPVPVLWAALDCPGGWSVDIVGRPMVLGTMTARVLGSPRRDERCVVVGRALEVTDRKALTASTLYNESGELLGVAAHVWVAVDPSRFQGQA